MSHMIHLTAAVAFAAERHKSQTRQGDAGEPYFNHVAEVAQLVADATAGRDPILIIGAYLHDVLMDPRTSDQELGQTFGENVASLVREVTDEPDLPFSERMRRQLDEMPTRSNRAKIIKLADKISHVRGIITDPPSALSVDERDLYVQGAEDLSRALAGVNRSLETEMKTVLTDARKAIRIQRFGK